MATLKDIAQALGVSPATVSRALNGFPEVNAKTRARVEEAAERLGYRPNALAKKLVSGRSGLIGLVLTHHSDVEAGDPLLLDLIFGLSSALAAQDMDLLFHAGLVEDGLEPYHRLMDKNILDGFILHAPLEDDPRVALLNDRKVPFVMHGRSPGAAYAYFDIENDTVMRDAVAHLHDLGHRRIAFLNGPAHLVFAQERKAAFLETMAERGLSVPDEAVQTGAPTEQSGFKTALGLLRDGASPTPTAILCASMPQAVGVFKAAQDLGLSVPHDLSVIAHDDGVPHLRGEHFLPSLTVTYAPLLSACAPLADLMGRLLGGEDVKNLQKRVKAEFIVRASTAAAPHR